METTNDYPSLYAGDGPGWVADKSGAFEAELAEAGIRAHFEAITKARLAVAEAAAYFDNLRQFVPMPVVDFADAADEIRTALCRHL